MSGILSTLIPQVSAIPDGQEILNRIFIGGLARDVSWKVQSNFFFHFDWLNIFISYIVESFPDMHAWKRILGVDICREHTLKHI